MLGATLGAKDYLERVCDEIRRLAPVQLEAISGSGNGPNILKAVDWANRHGLVTVGITGFGGGELRTPARHSRHADVADMGPAESLHQAAFHWIIDDLYRRISGPVAALAR